MADSFFRFDCFDPLPAAAGELDSACRFIALNSSLHSLSWRGVSRLPNLQKEAPSQKPVSPISNVSVRGPFIVPGAVSNGRCRADRIHGRRARRASELAIHSRLSTSTTVLTRSSGSATVVTSPKGELSTSRAFKATTAVWGKFALIQATSSLRSETEAA